MNTTHHASSEAANGATPGRLGRLAHFTSHYRWPVIAAWVVLTVFGGVAAGKLSSRWYQSLAVPGKPAYEAGQRTLKALGVGVRAPDVVVFHTSGDATRTRRSSRRCSAPPQRMPGARTSSYFSTGSLMYVSRDRHTTFAEVYPPGPGGLEQEERRREDARRRRATASRPESPST